MTEQGALPHWAQAAAALRSFSSSPRPQRTMAVAHVDGAGAEGGAAVGALEGPFTVAATSSGGPDSNATNVSLANTDSPALTPPFSLSAAPDPLVLLPLGPLPFAFPTGVPWCAFCVPVPLVPAPSAP